MRQTGAPTSNAARFKGMAKYKKPWWSGMSCYACNSWAVGEEHTPPKMVFPEAKDTNGIVYRDGIVKVPACHVHNEKFSKDDEYVSAIVTIGMLNNDVGGNHFKTKIFRAMSRKPGFARAVFQNPRPVRVNWQQTMAFTVDLKRWDRGMSKITAGLYFHATGKKIADWNTLAVHSPDLRLSSNLQAPLGPLRNRYDAATGWTEVKSGHPQVYRGRFIADADDAENFVFEHLFYEGFRVWVMKT